jgi:hypothetical protein
MRLVFGETLVFDVPSIDVSVCLCVCVLRQSNNRRWGEQSIDRPQFQAPVIEE